MAAHRSRSRRRRVSYFHQMTTSLERLLAFIRSLLDCGGAGGASLGAAKGRQLALRRQQAELGLLATLRALR